MMRASGASFVFALCWVGFACGSGGSPGPGGGTDANDDHADPVCGDGVCASSELNNCAEDCGAATGSDPGSDGSGSAQDSCGGLVCDTSKGEDATNCPSDCTVSGGSNGSGLGSGTCSEANLLACIDCEATLINESDPCPGTTPQMTLGDCDICILSSGL